MTGLSQERREANIERIAQQLFKHSTAVEGGYRSVPGYRWGQMTKTTQRRFRDIATKVYDGCVVDMVEAAEERERVLQAKVNAVEYLFAGRPDTPCRTVWAKDGDQRIECVEVPLDDLRAALSGEQP